MIKILVVFLLNMHQIMEAVKVLITYYISIRVLVMTSCAKIIQHNDISYNQYFINNYHRMCWIRIEAVSNNESNFLSIPLFISAFTLSFIILIANIIKKGMTQRHQ